jgi:hypothetical protein
MLNEMLFSYNLTGLTSYGDDVGEVYCQLYFYY